MFSMTQKASSKPIDLSDDVVSRVLPFQQECIRIHGKNSFIWMGPRPRINIMEPKLVKVILTGYATFQKPKTNPLIKLLVNGLSSFEGQQWTERRKILNPAFHFDKLKHILPPVQLSVDEMLKQWEMLAVKNGSCELDVWPYLQNLTGDMISRAAFGSCYEEGRKIFQLQKEQADIMENVFKTPYIPGWRFVPTKTNKRMKEIYNQVESTIKEIVSKREKSMKTGERNHDDLLGIMMESNLRELQERKLGMSLHDVIEECKLFYFAGQETTRNLLAWSMVLLGKHQEWQKRARDEVMLVFGKNKPDFNGLSHLKVVSMIIYEVLRLYPPVVELSRSIGKETKIGELCLPKEVLVTVPILLAHYDHDLWGDDAKEFKPERFSEGVSKATNHQLAAFNPFSMGPRICIGQNFALIEAKVALAMILQHFTFEISSSYVHAPYICITLQPQHGTQLILHKI